MDAFVQLALIEKAKRVFAADAGVMLSFPLLSPVSFTTAELAALAAPATANDYAAAAEFARVANFLPRDMVASASERMLWDVYRDVLTRAEVATGSGAAPANGADEQLLYTTADDGTRTESEALRAWRQYRDLWITAGENYAAHRLTGELSDDPAIRRQWTDVDEPALRAEVDEAVRDWETLGRRAEVDAALEARRNATLNAPGVRWAEWCAAFNPDVDMLTDAVGAHYAPTGLMPRDFAEKDDWLSFDLSASEMKALVEAAPEPLRRVLDDDGAAGVDRVTFQYRSVALVRPWFRPEVLTSGIWRSADPELTLSDGGDPLVGACPAYPAACVFVRNVAVTSSEGGRQPVFRDLRFSLNTTKLTDRPLRVEPALLARLLRQTGAPSAAEPVTAPPPVFRLLARESLALPAARARPSAALLARGPLIGRPIRLPPGGFGRPPPTPAPSPSPPPPPAADEVSILAFICKRLPRTPDPAPDLTWG